MAISPFELKQTMEDGALQPLFDWGNCPPLLRPIFSHLIDLQGNRLNLLHLRITNAEVPHIIAFLNAYPNITTLHISLDEIDGDNAEHLENISTLKTLNMSYTPILNNAQVLARNPILRNVDIAWNPLRRDSYVRYFTDCARDRQECLSYCNDDESQGGKEAYMLCMCLTSPCQLLCCTAACLYYPFHAFTTSPDSRNSVDLARDTMSSTLNIIRGDRLDNNHVQALGHALNAMPAREALLPVGEEFLARLVTVESLRPSDISQMTSHVTDHSPAVTFSALASSASIANTPTVSATPSVPPAVETREERRAKLSAACAKRDL